MASSKASSKAAAAAAAAVAAGTGFSVLEALSMAQTETRRQALKKFGEAVPAAIVAAALGAIAAAAYSCLRCSWETAADAVCSTFEVQGKSQVFVWLKAWLTEQPEFKRSSRRSTLQLAHELDPGMIGGTGAEQGGGGGAEQPTMGSGAGLAFSAGRGAAHWVRFKGAWVGLELCKNNPDHGGRTTEYWLLRVTAPTLTVLQRQLVASQLVEAGRDVYHARSRGRTEIYCSSEHAEWTSIGTRRSRSLRSVILPAGLGAQVMADARRFQGSAGWYADRGIPYRRGYLLHGQPGCGKTSLITALAGELRLNMCILNLSSAQGKLDDSNLIELFSSTPEDSLLVLEDVDAAFHGRTAVDGAAGGITFSGLLNAIDGVAAQEGRMLFMTTNHPERLDSALVRPGRVDLKVRIGAASVDQVIRLFVQFYRGADATSEQELEATAAQFAAVARVEDLAFSMATIQGHLLVYETPAAALANVIKLVEAGAETRGRPGGGAVQKI